jgi:hypothetical protein
MTIKSTANAALAATPAASAHDAKKFLHITKAWKFTPNFQQYPIYFGSTF